MALVDFTNPLASVWMTDRLAEFKAQATVRAFHFASGKMYGKNNIKKLFCFQSPHWVGGSGLLVRPPARAV